MPSVAGDQAKPVMLDRPTGGSSGRSNLGVSGGENIRTDVVILSLTDYSIWRSNREGSDPGELQKGVMARWAAIRSITHRPASALGLLS